MTQIGPVLDLEFPTGIQQILQFLKPFAIDLQSILQLDCLAGTNFTFYGFWVVRCFVLPGLMLGAVGLQYIYERQRVDKSTAIGYFKANAFVVVFLCYPGACNQAFSMYKPKGLIRGYIAQEPFHRISAGIKFMVSLLELLIDLAQP